MCAKLSDRASRAFEGGRPAQLSPLAKGSRKESAAARHTLAMLLLALGLMVSFTGCSSKPEATSNKLEVMRTKGQAAQQQRGGGAKPVGVPGSRR